MALRGNPETLMSIAVSHDGRTIAAAGIGSVVLWESCAPRGGYLPRKIANAARIVVDELYQKHGFYGEVISILQGQRTRTESIGTLALQIANSRRGEDAEKIEGELQKLANSRTNLEAHKAILDRAEMVNRVDPNDRFTLNVLGFAQYRVGAYEDALKTLLHVDQIRTKARLEHNPGDLAITAMSLHQLGRADEAKSTLQQLRALLKDERLADDEQAKALLAEAEGLILGVKR
jgi:tetratricopeptide (TPR) repeat protein